MRRVLYMTDNLKEREKKFVRRVKDFGGFVTVDRGLQYGGGDRYVIHMPAKQRGNSVYYKCPFCRERYKRDGYPYKRSRPHTHVHCNQGFDSVQCCLRSTHCPGASLSGNYPCDDVYFGITYFEVDLINMKKRKPDFWGVSEQSIILDHDVFPNEEELHQDEEHKLQLPYVTSFFSQKDLP